MARGFRPVGEQELQDLEDFKFFSWRELRRMIPSEHRARERAVSD